MCRLGGVAGPVDLDVVFPCVRKYDDCEARWTLVNYAVMKEYMTR